MNAGMTRRQALAALTRYNKEPFHLRHALTVERVMAWYARELGEDADFWALAGLVHDIDFEGWPEEHCVRCVPLCGDVAPVHLMEKVLFAADELTGLIGAAAKMRPSKSCADMELSSLKKKYKDKKFAAGCSREVIRQGAEMLGWELDTLMERTLRAMAATEADVEAECAALTETR